MTGVEAGVLAGTLASAYGAGTTGAAAAGMMGAGTAAGLGATAGAAATGASQLGPSMLGAVAPITEAAPAVATAAPQGLLAEPLAAGGFDAATAGDVALGQSMGGQSLGGFDAATAGDMSLGESMNMNQQLGLLDGGAPDPRAMDMGHANFNDPYEKMRLAGNKMMGSMKNNPMKTAQYAQKAQGLLSPQPQGGGGASAPRPQSGQAQQAQDIVEQLKRKRGNRSNWAGLLSAAIGSQR